MSKKKGDDEVKVLIFQYKASVVDGYQRQLFLFPLVNNNARQVFNERCTHRNSGYQECENFTINSRQPMILVKLKLLLGKLTQF